jgi:hypothetical protein
LTFWFNNACIARRNTRLYGRALTPVNLRSEEQQESGKQHASAPAYCHDSHYVHAADAMKSWIPDGIHDRRETGQQRRKYQAENHCSRYLDGAVATSLHIALLATAESTK